MAKYGPTPQAAPAGAIKLAPGADYQSIIDSAPTGAVFYFEKGTHRLTESLVAHDGQTFLGAAGAVIDGGRTITKFAQTGTTWRIDGQTQEGERLGTDEGRAGWDRAGYPETVFIDGEPQRPVDSLAKVEAGTFYFDYGRDQIHIGTDPTGKNVEVGVANQAFGGAANDVTVADLTFRHFNNPTQWGVVDGSNGTGWTVEDNDIGWSYGAGVYVGANSAVRGNYIHDLGQLGVNGDGDYSAITVEGNQIARNGHWSGIDRGFELGGVKISHAEDVVLRDNYVHDNFGPGLWMDGRNYNTLYEGNLITNNSGSGIQHEISYDAVMRNNVLIDNGAEDAGSWLWGAQILLQNSNNVEAYDNYVEFSEAGNGIVMIQQDRTGDAPNRGPYLTQDNKIHDNTMVSTAPAEENIGRIGGAADWNYDAMYTNGNNEWYGNSYYMDGTDRYWWNEESINFDQFEGDAGTIAPAAQAPGVDLSPWMGADDGGPIEPPTTEPPAPGNMDVVGTAGDDTLELGRGHDKANGLGGNDKVYARAGNDTVSGGAGHDKLWGQVGNDKLAGGSGNDFLTGGRGEDLLTGGLGNDTFKFRGDFGHDTITDFATGRGSGDVIDFRTLFDTFSSVLASAAQDGVDVHIAVSNDSSVRLVDVSLSSLRASDFHV